MTILLQIRSGQFRVDKLSVQRLKKERSTVAAPGPHTEFCGVLPNVPFGCGAKADRAANGRRHVSFGAERVCQYPGVRALSEGFFRDDPGRTERSRRRGARRGQGSRRPELIRAVSDPMSFLPVLTLEPRKPAVQAAGAHGDVLHDCPGHPRDHAAVYYLNSFCAK